MVYKFSASTVFPCHTSYLWERGEETGERDRVWYRHLLAHFWVAGDMLEEVREICHPLEQTSSFYRLLKWREAVCSVFHGERKRKRLQQTWWFTSCPCHWFWGRSARGCFCAGGSETCFAPYQPWGDLLQFSSEDLEEAAEEPSNLWVRISEYLGWWRTKGSHSRYSHNVRREGMGEMCRQIVGRNWVLERETSVEPSLCFRVLSLRLSL